MLRYELGNTFFVLQECFEKITVISKSIFGTMGRDAAALSMALVAFSKNDSSDMCARALESFRSSRCSLNGVNRDQRDSHARYMQ